MSHVDMMGKRSTIDPGDMWRLVLHLVADPSHCRDSRKIGGNAFWGRRPDGSFDGEWYTCFDRLPKLGCTVFSFGLGYDWSFDQNMSAVHGCHVHSYDPSMNLPRHIHKPGPVYFAPIALGSEDVKKPEPTEAFVSWRMDKSKPQSWNHRTLKSLMQTSGHRTLDVLKLDVESFEWAALLAAIEDHALDGVDQLLFEAHMNPNADNVKPLGGINLFIRTFAALEAHGFKLFKSVPNGFSKSHFVAKDGKKFVDCYELSYVRVPRAQRIPRRAGMTPDQYPIPLSLFQTNHKPPLSDHVEGWSRNNPGLKYTFMDDRAARRYLLRSWGPRHASAFSSLGIGAVRSDFLRLCYIADRGGFYADVDTCGGNISLVELRQTGAPLIVVPSASFTLKPSVWNAFFAAKPRHPALIQLVKSSLERIEKRYGARGGAEEILAIAGPNAMAPLLTVDGVLRLNMLAHFDPVPEGNKPERWVQGERIIGVKGDDGKTLLEYYAKPDMDPKREESLYNHTAWSKAHHGYAAMDCPLNWTKRKLQLSLKDPEYWIFRARQGLVYRHEIKEERENTEGGKHMTTGGQSWWAMVFG